MTDSYSRLLSWHAAHIRSVGAIEFGATILRTRSKALHDVLAYVATDDKYTVLQLQDLVTNGTFHEVKFRDLWLATLGRVVAIQALEEADPAARSSDLEFGMACLKHANRQLPRNQEHQQFHRLEIELSVRKSEVEEARELLDANEFLNGSFYGYLRSDLDNPTISRKPDTYDRWITGFNRPFSENGLLPIRHSASFEPNFNDLDTAPALSQPGGPKVSVLLTSFRPDRADFFTAVNSILKQSWQNLELIIVDDASPSEFEPVLEEAERLDSRVRIIRLEENGGTYRARNAGIAAATGDFITGQDSDDWSHPERLAAQINYLLENPSAPGAIVEAIRVDNSLVRTFPGRMPHGPCEVSFMLRAELAREVGGYLEVRKGADGEFRRRVEKYTDSKVEILDKPLYIIRIGHDSLSRADFRPGWSHPVRRAFWNSSRHWLENSPAAELRLAADGSFPIPVPDRFKIAKPQRAPEYDMVYVGDWREYSSTQRAMIDEIITLRGQEKTVGILHLESIISSSNEPSRFCFEIQAMVNNGEVRVVIPDESASTKTAIIHDPTILQFASFSGLNLNADLVIIKPDIPPPTTKSTEIMYLPKDCEDIARRLFDGTVIWTSNDPEIADLLTSFVPEIIVDTQTCPVAFRPKHWYHSRKKLESRVMTIGRHSQNHAGLWPKDMNTSLALWPCDGSGEVCILGDARSFLRKYEQSRFPVDWVVYRENEIRPEAFMSSIDFFVYFPDEHFPQGFCREALEAAAAGTLVILPDKFRKIHGETALYAEPREALELISYFRENPSTYKSRVNESISRLHEVYSNYLFTERLRKLANDR